MPLTELQPFIQFLEDRYWRETIYVCSDFEICCLSWRPGQHSTVHDHGQCRCCVSVVQGTLKNTIFGRDRQGRVVAIQSSDVPADNHLATAPHAIHRAGNFQHGENLVTLHVYSPPLGMSPNHFHPYKEDV